MIPFPYRDDNPSPAQHWDVILVIALNIAAASLWNERAIMALGFIPDRPLAHTWISSQFLHGGLLHLLGNMWALWLYGDNVAGRLRSWFLPFYLAGGAAANLAHYWTDPTSSIPTIGASGAVCAVTGAYAVLFPNARLRCMTIFGMRRIFMPRMVGYYTISAAYFTILFLLWQFYGIYKDELLGRPSRIAYAAHLGGLFFGAVVGLLLRDGSAVSRNETPLSPEQAGIEAFLSAGKTERAVQAYAEASRRGDHFDWSPETALTLARALAETGYPHLARGVLDSALKATEPTAAAPLHLLLGSIEQGYFRDLGAAARHYESAATEPAAQEDIRREARLRFDEAKSLLGKTAAAPLGAEERCSVVLETEGGVSQSSQALIKTTLQELGLAPAAAFGFVVSDAPAKLAFAAAERLEKAGIPVVAVPSAKLLPLPPVRLCLEAASDASGLNLRLKDESVSLLWNECLLLSVFGVPFAEPERKTPGIFEVDVERVDIKQGFRTIHSSVTPAEYEKDNPPLFVLDAIGTNPYARYRVLSCPDLSSGEESRQRFLSLLKSIAADASSAPSTRGLRMAQDGILPPEFFFQNMTAAESRLLWELQLARLRWEGYYSSQQRIS